MNAWDLIQCPTCGVAGEYGEQINSDGLLEIRYLMKVLAVEKPWCSVKSLAVRDHAVVRMRELIGELRPDDFIRFLVELEKETITERSGVTRTK